MENLLVGCGADEVSPTRKMVHVRVEAFFTELSCFAADRPVDESDPRSG